MDSDERNGGAGPSGTPPGKDSLGNPASTSVSAQGNEQVEDMFAGMDTWAVAFAAVLVLLGLVNGALSTHPASAQTACQKQMSMDKKYSDFSFASSFLDKIWLDK